MVKGTPSHVCSLKPSSTHCTSMLTVSVVHISDCVAPSCQLFCCCFAKDGNKLTATTHFSGIGAPEVAARVAWLFTLN